MIYHNQQEFINTLSSKLTLPFEVTGKVEASENYILNLTFLNLIDIRDFTGNYILLPDEKRL
ncbi:hypothetical protein, partial [Faucicola atlantae]